MLNQTHLHGERIVAVFPCIGGSDALDSRIVDMSVVTTDENDRFKVYPAVDPDGHVRYPGVQEDTLPRALRRARQNLGWG